MSPFLKASDLLGCSVQSQGRALGRVAEFWFDERAWDVRYLVVDLGRWLFRRKVLIFPQAAEKLYPTKRLLTLRLTQEQVWKSPRVGIDQHGACHPRPCSGPGCALHCCSTEALTDASDPVLLVPAESVNEDVKPFDPHLRATRGVKGYDLQAMDDVAGRVTDLLIERTSWSIEYIIVEANNDRTVLLPTTLVTGIDVAQKRVRVSITSYAIRACPAFEPSYPLHPYYEELVQAHYAGAGRSPARI